MSLHVGGSFGGYDYLPQKPNKPKSQDPQTPEEKPNYIGKRDKADGTIYNVKIDK